MADATRERALREEPFITITPLAYGHVRRLAPTPPLRPPSWYDRSTDARPATTRLEPGELGR
jgi:hypothetical protein